MSRGKVGILASLTLFGLSFMLPGPGLAADHMTVSEPAASTDDLEPAAPENASAVVDNEAPSVTISFDRSPDDGARQVPFGTNFATGGFVSGSAASVSIVNDVAGYRIDCEGSDGSSATFDTADDAFEATDSGGLSYFDDGVDNGVTYTCGIVAYDAAGNESDPITLTAEVEVLAVAPGPPGQLDILSVDGTIVNIGFVASPNDVPGHADPMTFYRISVDGSEQDPVEAVNQSFHEVSVDVGSDGDYLIAVSAVTVVEGVEFESSAVPAAAVVRFTPPGAPFTLFLDLVYDVQNAQFVLDVEFWPSFDDDGTANLTYDFDISNLDTADVPATGALFYTRQVTFAQEGDVTVSVATRDNDTGLLSGALTGTVTATVPEIVPAQLALPSPVQFSDLDPGQQDLLSATLASQIALAANIPVDRVIVTSIADGSLIVDFEIIPSEEPSEEEPTVQEAFANLETEIESDPQTFTEELTQEIAAEDPTLAQELDFGEPVVAEIAQSSQSLGSTFKDEEIRARVTVINQLGEADEITIEVEGDGFSISETSLTLDAGAEGSFDIVFSASENGDYEGTVTISTNDPANPGEIVTVSATVAPDPPDIALSADAIEYETTLVGDSSDETLTISNDGEADLNVILNVLGDEGFSVPVDDETEITVLGGESVDVIVTFTPVDGGDFAAFLVVESDDPDAEQAILIVTLSGDALVPVAGIALSDDTIDFGTLLVGDSASETLTIENTGISDLEVELELEGDMVFSVTGETMFTISGGGSADVEVVAEPDADGDFAGTLVVNSNDPENPSLDVDLSVTGVEPLPEIDVSPLAAVFGSVALGNVASTTVTISNTGDADLTGDITISGDDVFTISPGGPFTVLADESLSLEITFKPEAEADYQATINITSNDADEPEIMIQAVGTGVSKVQACVSAAGEILRTDFDGDGAVGYAEFFALVDHFNTTLGDEGYDLAFDLNGDGAIDYPDFFAYLDDFGETCTLRFLPTLRITNATAAPGGQVTVTVEVIDGEGIGALGFDLIFDTSLFTLDDADKTGLGDSDNFDLTSVDEGDDRVTGSFLSSAGLPEDESTGSLVEVMLTIDENAFAGIVVGLELEVTELADANGNPIPADVVDGRVTIQ
jgi:uncharacterized membrane protein